MTEKNFDVIVVGGGTSGSIAALAAARGGARTCLVEGSGYVGGTCLALANVTPFHNNRGEAVVGGYPQEFIERMVAAGGAIQGGHLPNLAGIGGSFTPLDPDTMKIVLFEMLAEAGVELWLHTMLVEPVMQDGRPRGVRVLNKSGLQEVGAGVIVDATGDADVAVRAGAAYTQDVAEETLNATLLFRVGGVDTDAFVADFRRTPAHISLVADAWLREARGITPEKAVQGVGSIYDCPYIYLANLVRDFIPKGDWGEWEITAVEKPGWGRLRFLGSRFSIMPLPSRKDLVTINASSITFDATDAIARSRAEVEGHKQVRTIMEVLRRYVPGFRDCHLHSTLPQVSIRASRRIKGVYQLTRDDVAEGRRFPDGVARGSYPMSVQTKDQPNVRQHLFVAGGGDYDIPYRCFVPEAMDGLLVAGRCLSATREASGSARMGAQCMAYGQAAGTAAALAVAQGVEPRAVDAGELRGLLKRARAII